MKNENGKDIIEKLYYGTLIGVILFLLIMITLIGVRYDNKVEEVNYLEREVSRLKLDSITWHGYINNWCSYKEVTHQELIDFNNLMKYYEEDKFD